MAAAVTCILWACDGQRVVADDFGGVSLAVHVAPPLSFGTAAATLSWRAETVPGAMVVVTSVMATAIPDTAITDSLGVARFSGLPAGEYTVLASRALTADEIVRAGTAAGGSVVLTTLVQLRLGDQDEQVTRLRLAPIDRGSLLFLEFSPLAQRASDSRLYYHSDYFRIYNNTDTSVALADKLFVNAFPSYYDYRAGNDCGTFSTLMRDPAGVWAQLIYRFPVDAKSLAPGQTALIVTDAIDHREIARGAPGLHDFSRADFEFLGVADVDNPAVPNLVSVGPREADPLGHGWHGFDLRGIYLLANALDLLALPRQYNAVWGGGSNFVRIPNSAILDVLSASYALESPFRQCPPTLLSGLDAEEARLLPDGGAYSLHRRVLARLLDGRAILQRSRNSAADWVLGSMTPFAVP